MYVKNNAGTLCPSPWRVPTAEDFCTLDKTLFGTSTCANRSSATGIDTYSGSLWGGTYGGACNSQGERYGQGTNAYYRSSTDYDSSDAYHLYYNVSSNLLFPLDTNRKAYGLQVRCVK
jgi:uncharacterized protein (TIGR02145 family)